MSLGSGGGRFVRLWRCLLSVPLGEQASGRRWWDCSGLGHVARRCFGTKWYDEVPGARSTRDGDTGNEDNISFARFFKLDKYAMFSFAMTSGLASDSDKFKIIITLRRAQKFGDTGPYKNFIFFNNPLTDKFFWKFELNAMGRICLISVKGLIHHRSKHIGCKINAEPSQWEGVQLIHHRSKLIGCKIKTEPDPWEGGAILLIPHRFKHIECKIKAEPGPWEGVQLIHYHSKHIGCNLKLLFQT